MPEYTAADFNNKDLAQWYLGIYGNTSFNDANFNTQDIAKIYTATTQP